MSDSPAPIDGRIWFAGLVFLAIAFGLGTLMAPTQTAAPLPPPKLASKADSVSAPAETPKQAVVAVAATAAKEAAAAKEEAAEFRPPPDAEIGSDEFGKMVRLGQAIFHDTKANAGGFVGNDLACRNCHIDDGRKAGSAPLWAAYVIYPQYRKKNGHVNSFEERLQGCFRYSMNGKSPPLGDRTLVALESYAFFLAKGAPTGVKMKGQGYPKLAEPPKLDPAAGAKVYAANCALCHAADGGGQKAADGSTAFPPLWGPRSYNWGAGMSSVSNAAAFIKANMPYGVGGTLSDADAWAVAAYIDSQERPQDPRFDGSIETTRKKFHDSPMSYYGQAVDGRVVGANATPSGISAGN